MRKVKNFRNTNVDQMTQRGDGHSIRRSRRELLATCSAGIAGSTAGCGSISGGSGEESSEQLNEVPWPAVRTDEINDWQRTQQRAQKRGEILGVSVLTKTRRWTDSKLQQQIANLTLGAFDRPLSQFFATTVELRGLFSGQATPNRIMDEVVPTFRRSLNEGGIQQVRPGQTEFVVPSPADNAVSREFIGHFRTPAIERTVTIPDASEQTVRLDAGQLAVRGVITVWKPSNSRAFVAGGVHPAEDYEKRDRITVTGNPNKGVDIVIVIDLGINPTRLAETVVRLSEAVRTVDS